MVDKDISIRAEYSKISHSLHIVHFLISLNYHLLQKTVSLIEVKSIGTAIFNQELFYCYYILVGLYSSDGFRCRFHLIKWVSNTVKK